MADEQRRDDVSMIHVLTRINAGLFTGSDQLLPAGGLRLQVFVVSRELELGIWISERPQPIIDACSRIRTQAELLVSQFPAELAPATAALWAGGTRKRVVVQTVTDRSLIGDVIAD